MSAKRSKKRSRTDWARIDTLDDSAIDYSDIPPLAPGFFKEAIRWPGPKKQITIRLDPDVLAFFRKSSKRYQTTINAVLKRYVQVQKGRSR